MHGEPELGGAAPPVPVEEISVFAGWGIVALVTTRGAGDFSLSSSLPTSDVLTRWRSLSHDLGPVARRLILSRQLHGTRVIPHLGGWEGMLIASDADGHFTMERGTALAVTVADCIPVFLAHPA